MNISTFTATDKNITSTENKIVELVQQHIHADKNDQFSGKGRECLLEQVRYFIANKKKLEFILPGFPCKSPNDVDKTFSAMPDYGEVMAIERLDEFCTQLNEIYPLGSELTILSDGTTFVDIVHVSEETKENYKKALPGITLTENIVWADLSSILPDYQSKDKSSPKMVKALLKSIGKGPRSFEKFIDKVKNDSEQTAVHDKLCSYLYHDINLESFSEGNRDKYLESISEKAFEMMYRGRALNNGIQTAFPDHIRLSVHQYDNSGPKFTFSFNNNNQKTLSPWHSVPVRLLNGEFIQLPHSIAKERLLAKVSHLEQNWFYMEVSEPALTEFTYEVMKGPKFGLTISDPKQVGYHHFSTHFLQKLCEDFGFIVLKNAAIADQAELVNYCQPFGNIYHWKFGAVQVVKPEENPTGFVHSIEKTPLHWDLSMLPSSDENVKNNLRFAAKIFMLYCKTPPEKGEGQTTLVDSRKVLKVAGASKVKSWKEIEITYQTKMTYFGGDPHTYPLVFEHPINKDDIFRYQEGSELEIQQFSLSCDKYSKDEFKKLINELNEIAYNEHCMVKHEWQAGDLVIVDNYYTLHGRLPMTKKSMSRELWRVQVS